MTFPQLQHESTLKILFNLLTSEAASKMDAKFQDRQRRLKPRKWGMMEGKLTTGERTVRANIWIHISHVGSISTISPNGENVFAPL